MKTNSYSRQQGRAVIGALAGVVVGFAAGWYFGMQNAPRDSGAMPATLSARPAAVAPVAVKFGFEADRPLGWTCGDYEKAQACKQVTHFNELHQEGLSSLKFDLDLAGGHARRGSGEIWIDVNANPPAGQTGPVSLAGRTLTAWVYAAPGAVGDKSKPNGLQLFVKDGDWTAQYGPWQDVMEGQWTQVSFPMGAATPEFDPSQVNAIGLKIASGEGSEAKFQGAIYVDAVNW